jgi:hypothetical protein
LFWEYEIGVVCVCGAAIRAAIAVVFPDWEARYREAYEAAKLAAADDMSAWENGTMYELAATSFRPWLYRNTMAVDGS